MVYSRGARAFLPAYRGQEFESLKWCAIDVWDVTHVRKGAKGCKMSLKNVIWAKNGWTLIMHKQKQVKIYKNDKKNRNFLHKK